MTTDGGSPGGSGTGSSGAGGLHLDAEHVRGIAGTLGNQGQELRDSGFADLSSLASAFGASDAGRELGGNYDGAHADSVQQNTDCEAVLSGFEVGLLDAVQGLQETDEVNGLALTQIGVLNPGEADSWRRR